MIWKVPLILLLTVLGLRYFIEYRDWLDWSRNVPFRSSPGPCETVLEDGGSEDVEHIGNGLVLITQGFNLLHMIGSVKLLNLHDNSVTTLNMTDIPERPDFMASPHGMTTWRDPDTDQLFVYVITHPPTEDAIEIFELTPDLVLSYVKTITDPGFLFMNDLVAVGKDRFYITKFWAFRKRFYIFLESSLRMRNGGIMYYDGNRAHDVATGFFMPNGINISPDKTLLYMAESGAKTLHALRREADNAIVKFWDVNLQTSMDNIDVEASTGDLWIGTHDLRYMNLDFYNLFGYTKPSKVIRVKIRDYAVSSVETIYSDDGREISGSSVAAYVNGKLVVGSVMAQCVVCDVKYMSP